MRFLPVNALRLFPALERTIFPKRESVNTKNKTIRCPVSTPNISRHGYCAPPEPSSLSGGLVRREDGDQRPNKKRFLRGIAGKVTATPVSRSSRKAATLSTSDWIDRPS